jgi:hypothetical protein
MGRADDRSSRKPRLGRGGGESPHRWIGVIASSAVVSALISAVTSLSVTELKSRDAARDREIKWTQLVIENLSDPSKRLTTEVALEMGSIPDPGGRLWKAAQMTETPESRQRLAEILTGLTSTAQISSSATGSLTPGDANPSNPVAASPTGPVIDAVKAFAQAQQYWSPENPKPDYKEALRLFRIAADRGDPRAMANVGWIYEAGLLGAPDCVTAMQWYDKAARNGDKVANWNIGRLYELGCGVKRDLEQARTWYKKAAHDGVYEGERDLKRLDAGNAMRAEASSK